MIIGSAGHIDHGKTSLVLALTGIDTDRLPEEKARGITLDLGFAYVPLPDGGTLGFVDVPGHERLVHTMIAGATSIAMAMLVVAADDGVMPQTREHLQILRLLGIDRLVVALNKIDLVDDARADEVELDILGLLEGTAWPDPPVFRVSAVTGAGIDALRAHLCAAAAAATRSEDGQARLRLSVDRCFSLPGAGTIVTGSVASGRVAVGDQVSLLPSGLRARVRGIHAANQPVERAEAGARCALNLAGASVHKDAIGRGDWVVDPDGASVSQRCGLAVSLVSGDGLLSRNGGRVLVHHGAGQVAGRLVPLAMDEAGGLAQLTLDRPLPLRFGDRLILRDVAATRTMGGGRVLDPRSSERRRSARLAVLRAVADAGSLAGALTVPPYLVPAASLLADGGWRARPEGLVDVGDCLATPAGLAQLTASLRDALAGFHADQPAEPHMGGEALRRAMSVRLPRERFQALAAHLAGTGVIQAEASRYRLPDHRGALAGAEGALWDALRPVLEAGWFRPPLPREAASAIGAGEVVLRRACKGFARLGLVVEMAPDRFFLRDAASALAQAARAEAAERGSAGFTAAQFRDRVGCGRQLAIQVLDYLDRRGVTVRRGDMRWQGRLTGL